MFLRRVEEVWNLFLSHFPFGSIVVPLLDTSQGFKLSHSVTLKNSFTDFAGRRQVKAVDKICTCFCLFVCVHNIIDPR